MRFPTASVGVLLAAACCGPLPAADGPAAAGSDGRSSLQSSNSPSDKPEQGNSFGAQNRYSAESDRRLTLKSDATATVRSDIGGAELSSPPRDNPNYGKGNPDNLWGDNQNDFSGRQLWTSPAEANRRVAGPSLGRLTAAQSPEEAHLWFGTVGWMALAGLGAALVATIIAWQWTRLRQRRQLRSFLPAMLAASQSREQTPVE